MLITYNGDGTVTVHTDTCMVCSKKGTVIVPEKEWLDYQSPTRPFIQNALKSVDSAEREQIMTGTHGPCWDKMWEDVDDDN